MPGLRSKCAAILAAVAVLVATAPAATGENAKPSAKSDAPEWTLVDHTGRKVTDRDFNGRFRLVVFGYTYCPDVCPTALGDVSEVMERLGQHARFVVPIFVTIDPRRDTSEVLADYLANFDPRIVGLTGPEAEVEAVRESYGVVSVPGPADEDGTYFIAHSALKYLVGPGGEPIRHFAHDDPPAKIVAYLNQLFLRIGI